MKRTTILALAVAAAILATAASASARSFTTTGCQPWRNLTYWPGAHPFKTYLTGLGRTAPAKVVFPAGADGSISSTAPKLPFTTAPLCGSSALTALGSKAMADMTRFYQLRNAFPARPTAAQWKTRIKPLLAAAIASDTDLVAVYKQAASDDVSAFNASRHCGQAPNPANLCDNQTLPESVATYPYGAGLPAITADLAWLKGHAAPAFKAL